jgi:hypothetical protein
MSAAALGWFLAIVGTVASVAGVVFSWLAWVQAAKAKVAAREAANAVRRRNLADEVLKLAGDAKEFLSAVQHGQRDSAISAANGLLHSLSIVRSRGVADSLDMDTLKMCLGQIVSVAICLTVDGVPVDPTKREDLLGLCHEIHRLVCDLAGRFERLSEGAAI